MSKPGELFIVSAPSGAGKTTLIQGLMQGACLGFGQVAFSVSHTTRRPRSGEQQGVDYHFVEESVFRDMIAADRFLEWAEVHGRLYGTSFAEVLPRLREGTDVILDIDVQGAEKVMARRSKGAGETGRGIDGISAVGVHTIFVMPPSFAVLERRLRGRQLDELADIVGRLRAAREEVKQVCWYDYVIVNNDATAAACALAAIVLEKRYRRKRMDDAVTVVLGDFDREGGGTTATANDAALDGA